MNFKILKLEDKIKIILNTNKSIYGYIKKIYSEKRLSDIYEITFYFKDIYQHTVYEDTLNDAEDKLKNILIKINNDELISFEQF